MIRIDYKFINDIFEKVWGASEFSAITEGLKILAISFLLTRYAWIIYKSWADQKKMGSSGGEVSLPISPRQLGTYFAICLTIAFYDQLLLFLDSILGSLLSVYSKLDVTSISIPLKNADDEQKEALANAGSLEALKIFALQALDVLTSPSLWLLSIVKVVVWLIDVTIYSLVLSERFFVLLILKFTGPLAICMSLIPKLNAMFWKWVALYARWYLLIIPYLLVNLTVNAFVGAYELIFSRMNSDVAETIGETVEVPFLVIIVLLKLTLFRTAKTIYNELIDINMNEDD